MKAADDPIMRVVLPIVGALVGWNLAVPRLGCLTWLSVPLSDLRLRTSEYCARASMNWGRKLPG